LLNKISLYLRNYNGYKGKKIHSWRRAKDWKQTQLAMLLDTSQSVVSDIENDKLSPTWEMINIIADAWQIQVQDLLPINANNIFHNQQNETVNNITNKHESNIELERSLWQKIIDTKDEEIEILKDEISKLDIRIKYSKAHDKLNLNAEIEGINQRSNQTNKE
jgi:transcriptional regulator with XRE-family HTH domain